MIDFNAFVMTCYDLLGPQRKNFIMLYPPN